jgi:hypothetical protein
VSSSPVTHPLRSLGVMCSIDITTHDRLHCTTDQNFLVALDTLNDAAEFRAILNALYNQSRSETGGEKRKIECRHREISMPIDPTIELFRFWPIQPRNPLPLHVINAKPTVSE